MVFVVVYLIQSVKCFQFCVYSKNMQYGLKSDPSLHFVLVNIGLMVLLTLLWAFSIGSGSSSCYGGAICARHENTDLPCSASCRAGWRVCAGTCAELMHTCLRNVSDGDGVSKWTREPGGCGRRDSHVRLLRCFPVHRPGREERTLYCIHPYCISIHHPVWFKSQGNRCTIHFYVFCGRYELVCDLKRLVPADVIMFLSYPHAHIPKWWFDVMRLPAASQQLTCLLSALISIPVSDHMFPNHMLSINTPALH